MSGSSPVVVRVFVAVNWRNYSPAAAAAARRSLLGAPGMVACRSHLWVAVMRSSPEGPSRWRRRAPQLPRAIVGSLHGSNALVRSRFTRPLPQLRVRIIADVVIGMPVRHGDRGRTARTDVARRLPCSAQQLRARPRVHWRLPLGAVAHHANRREHRAVPLENRCRARQRRRREMSGAVSASSQPHGRDPGEAEKGRRR